MSGRSRIATDRSPSDPCSRTSRTSSHSSNGPSDSCSDAGIHATGSLVVGRRTDAGLTAEPASALRRLDLPTPVPPTSASTYASDGNPSRRSPSASVARISSVPIPRTSAASVASRREARHRRSASSAASSGAGATPSWVINPASAALGPRRQPPGDRSPGP